MNVCEEVSVESGAREMCARTRASERLTFVLKASRLPLAKGISNFQVEAFFSSFGGDEHYLLQLLFFRSIDIVTRKIFFRIK